MDPFVTSPCKRANATGESGNPRKRIKLEEEDEESPIMAEFSNPIPWQKIEAEELDCDYALLFSKQQADELFKRLEKEVEYFTEEETRVLVFGKLHRIPRKQATYGDSGLMYSFSGVHLLARPWTPTLEYIRDAVTDATGNTFNFVLVNRYKDGHDHICEHRDDERELDPTCPIASVSLGAARDFMLRHRDSRGQQPQRRIKPVKLLLAHGSLLLMNQPTNTHWYHSVPPRKRVLTPRINLTFRRIVTENVLGPAPARARS
uniref:DNA oxidative demethylase ALKBH2 n=1 Tax=Paramormyrops kingsleyae TaxID=1676925 RepID=A0A3B3QUS0_9TELE|nr:DNA oxidative demethylase ALKBH2 [Paramormyrops kingsleyae]XP_023689153.1 DNA oxidative demethylase ALKBH2 [Paramormyrops kingsleyae]XP_023689154.1 DNA oxidative demethylase ALKBH2 [Paramormyrops kingsleyae]